MKKKKYSLCIASVGNRCVSLEAPPYSTSLPTFLNFAASLTLLLGWAGRWANNRILTGDLTFGLALKYYMQHLLYKLIIFHVRYYL